MARTQEAPVKPTYTVRLTGDLNPEERERVAQRVAGVTDIGAEKIVRLLERGEGRDLIKPSSAAVANRLARVLAEAGAPVQLVPLSEADAAPAEASSFPPEAASHDDAEDAAVRPRQTPARDVAVAQEEGTRPQARASEAARAPDEEAAVAVGTDASPAHGPTEGELRREVPATEPAEPGPSEPGEVGQEVREVEARPRPAQDARPVAEPGASGRAKEAPRHAVEPTERPAKPRSGSAVLGAIGAALLGIGAFLAMDSLVSPIAIGVLVLAVLSLGLALLGQRRAIWLPGLGALALVAWALVNAEGGALGSLAANWTWYAMFAGAILVILAGVQESQRGRR